MLAAMRGEATDRIPWAPRMDLAYIAWRARNEVPKRFVGMNTAQIAEELDVACHAVRGDYTLARAPEDLALRGLGMDNHPDYACRIEVRDLKVEFHHEDGCFDTTIHAPAGPVTMRLRMTREMSADGISLPFVEKYPISSPADFEAVAQVFEHLEVIPTPRAYQTFHDRIGDQGVAVPNGPLGATPMHLLLHDVMAMEEFFVLYMEDREAMRALAARMQPFYDAMLDASLASSAECVFWGANYDHDTTWPPFFEAEILPGLQGVAKRCHDAGKLLMTHTDGETRQLMPLIPRCGFDVGESVCTKPMTSCSLKEFREGYGPDVTVFGGIPCVVLMDQVTDQASFESYMDEMFAELGSGRRLILGVSDNVPPEVNLDRLEQVKKWIDAFGPVGV